MNVIAMLISFVALIALTNALLGWVGGWIGVPDLSLQKVFGWVFAPIAWSLGVPWKDAGVIGNLLGTRMVLNEFIAFAQLGPMKDALDPRSFTVATFALCGFANFASIGIQIGGIGALVPERRHDLARLGLRAMLAGTLANFVSACIAAHAALDGQSTVLRSRRRSRRRSCAAGSEPCRRSPSSSGRASARSARAWRTRATLPYDDDSALAGVARRRSRRQARRRHGARPARARAVRPRALLRRARPRARSRSRCACSAGWASRR